MPPIVKAPTNSADAISVAKLAKTSSKVFSLIVNTPKASDLWTASAKQFVKTAFEYLLPSTPVRPRIKGFSL